MVEAPTEPRKSMQSVRKSTPYNDNFMKTYDSSEFDPQSPDQLPGMIFGLASSQQKQPSSSGPPIELIASQLSQ